MSAERVPGTRIRRPEIQRQRQAFASENEIRQKYGDEGYQRIVEMGYKDEIMKNYKNPNFGEDNYYPIDLSVEDINEYILAVTRESDEPGIENRVFKTFKCGNFKKETEEYFGLLRRIRDRQLFETKLGIRDKLSHVELNNITTMVLNNEDVGVEADVMDRNLLAEVERVPEDEELPKKSLLEATAVADTKDFVNVDLIRMKQEQDEWFNSIKSENIKKLFCVQLPAYAVFLASVFGCIALGTCLLGGEKKRKNKRMKSTKKKQRRTKRITKKGKKKRKGGSKTRKSVLKPVTQTFLSNLKQEEKRHDNMSKSHSLSKPKESSFKISLKKKGDGFKLTKHPLKKNL